MNSFSWIFDIGFRRMNEGAAPGWAPQMLVFSALGLAVTGAAGVGLPLEWPLTVIGAVDLLLTQHFVRGFVRRIRRLGCVAPTRARWWIELAALDWTLCISSGLFALVHGNRLAALPGWQKIVVAFAGNCARGLFPSFFALTLLGFFLGLFQRKRIRGRSIELVNWFFWLIIGLFASLLLVPEAPVLTNWVAPVIAIIGVGVLCAAGIVALRQWTIRPSARVDVNPSEN